MIYLKCNTRFIPGASDLLQNKSMMKEELKQRVAKAIKESGKSQKQIADQIGVTPQAITRWLKVGTISKDNLFKLAMATDSSFYWLASGMEGHVTQLSSRNTVKVPVITWEQAAEFYKTGRLKISQKHENWVLCAKGQVSDLAYALMIESDSMVNPYPGHISFLPGMRIVIDPMGDVEPGKFVIAYLEDTDEVTFRQLSGEGKTNYIKTLNPQYPTLAVDQTINVCGVAVHLEMPI